MDACISGCSKKLDFKAMCVSLYPLMFVSISSLFVVILKLSAADGFDGRIKLP